MHWKGTALTIRGFGKSKAELLYCMILCHVRNVTGSRHKHVPCDDSGKHDVYEATHHCNHGTIQKQMEPCATVISNRSELASAVGSSVARIEGTDVLPPVIVSNNKLISILVFLIHRNSTFPLNSIKRRQRESV